MFTAGINIHLKYVSCDHLRLDFIERKVSNFITTFITYGLQLYFALTICQFGPKQMLIPNQQA